MRFGEVMGKRRGKRLMNTVLTGKNEPLVGEAG